MPKIIIRGKVLDIAEIMYYLILINLAIYNFCNAADVMDAFQKWLWADIVMGRNGYGPK